MACAASTEIGAAAAVFSIEGAWELDPQVSLRRERFGGLAYHFGTRRLSFLKAEKLLGVVEALGQHPSAREACTAAGVEPDEIPVYESALQTLVRTHMIRERDS